MLLLCLGYGYSAQRVAAKAATHRMAVIGTSRDGRDGTLAYHGGEVSDALRRAIADATHILISIPPHGNEPALAQAVAEHGKRARWLGYLSTTGVYGDRAGKTVDETSALAPMDAQAEARVQSERVWRGQGAQIFRLAGIYGPGRSVFEAIAEGRGQIIEKPGHRFNRIHADDIAQALWASMHAPTPGEIYNLADDAPAPQADVMRYAYRMLGRKAPQPTAFADAKLSPMGQRFWAASRQVDASKIKRCHGLNWMYPTYREGLAAILQESAQS